MPYSKLHVTFVALRTLNECRTRFEDINSHFLGRASFSAAIWQLWTLKPSLQHPPILLPLLTGPLFAPGWWRARGEPWLGEVGRRATKVLFLLQFQRKPRTQKSDYGNEMQIRCPQNLSPVFVNYTLFSLKVNSLRFLDKKTKL